MTLIEEYIENRDKLDHVFLLIDSKVGVKNSDIDMFDLLGNCSRKFSIILTKIDKAIKKISDDTYGYCEETGEPIGLKRLIARPIATLTIEAQEKHEKNEKVFASN